VSLSGRTRVASLLIALFGMPALAHAACNHPSICDTTALLADRACCGATSCTLDGTYTVSGAVCDFDFGARNVILSGSLAVGSSVVTIEARSLALRGPLTATGAPGNAGGDVTITLTGGANPALRTIGTGGMDLSGYGANGGGALTVLADGPMVIAGTGILANALEPIAAGGDIRLTTTSGSITIDNNTNVQARGGTDGDGGTITITSAGDTLVNPGALVSVAAGDEVGAGGIAISAGGAATFGLASHIEADGLPATGGVAGTIDILANAVSGLGDITAVGVPGAPGAGGDGGDISIEARTGQLLLQRNAGGVLADANGGGLAGTVTLQTDALTNTAAGTDGTIVVNAPISTQGLGSLDDGSSGGSVSITASGDLQVMRPVNANSMGGSFGGIDLLALRNVTITAPVTGTDPEEPAVLTATGHDIEVQADMLATAPLVDPNVSGDGGEIDLTADDDINVRTKNRLDVSGSLDGGGGAISVLSGRNFLLEFEGLVIANGGQGVTMGGAGGPGGQILVAAGFPVGKPSDAPALTGDITINGEIDALGASGGAGSSIELDACALSLLGTVDSRGDASGTNILTGRKSINIGGVGHLFAPTQNLLRQGGTLVIAPATTVTPAPTVEQHAPCTAPGVPANCLMPCPTCGNGQVEFPETCDPGSATDRCAAGCAHCQTEACNADICIAPDCDPLGGCLGRPKDNGTACDDADVCDGHEECINGSCRPGARLVCDDHNICTTDTCDPVAGCTFTNISGPHIAGCDDENPCNGVETCGGGTCNPGTPPVCQPPFACNRTNGTCDRIPCTPPDATPCDDANVCTTDACVADASDPTGGHCQNTRRPDDTPCPDSDACNGAETCQGGVCTSAPPLDCDDGHFCTADSCDPALGCQNVRDPACCELDAECDDHDPCTADTCVDHQCTNVPIPNCCQTASDCDDGNPCNGVETCSGQDRCVPGTNLPDTTPCDDDTVCNGREQCSNGACVVAVQPPSCASSDVCVDEFCDPTSGCVMQPIAGCCHNDGECDDNNACTADACSPDTHTCSHVTADQSCRPCQSDTDCDPEGRCAGQACQPDKTCTTVPLPCDDHNPHTFDRCTLDAQLVPICKNPCRDDQACDDGKVCNGAEHCQNETCVPGTAPDCDDRDLCTDDGCAEAQSGCFHTQKTSFPAVSCRLDGVDAALAGAAPTDLAATYKKKLQKVSSQVRAKLELAIQADQAGNAKKRTKLLRATSAGLKSAAKTVKRGVAKKKISSALGGTLQQLLSGGLDAVTPLISAK
jgi:hypothetical protein